MINIPMSRRQFGILSAAAWAGGPAIAQIRPDVAKILVPFPAGGTTDLVARLLAEQLRGDVADIVVVENKTGAAGRIAIAALKQAPADGSTLMLHALGIQMMYPHTLKQLGYEPFADVAPISITNRVDSCFAVGPAVPAQVRSLKDYFDWVKGDPRRGSFASAGSGTPQHFMPIAMGQQVKVELTPVHYRSSTVAYPDVLGGMVPAICTPLNDAMQQLATGKLRLLATTGDKRNSLTPDVSTFAEQGFPQLVDSDFFAVFVHGSTPAPLQERLSASVRKALAAPALVTSFHKAYIEPLSTTPAETLRLARAGYERNARLVKDVGYQPE